MAIPVATLSNFGRGLDIGVAVANKITVDIGAGLKYVGNKILLDTASLPMDVYIVSGAYNAGTNSIDMTMSNGSIVSIPVSSLIPISVGNGLTGDGQLATPVAVVSDPASPTVVSVSGSGVSVAAPTASQVNAVSTHTLSSSVNTITSVVNGISVTAPAVNSVATTFASGNLTVTVNGVASTPVSIGTSGVGDGFTITPSSPYGVISKPTGGLNSSVTGVEIRVNASSPLAISTALGLSVALPTSADMTALTTHTIARVSSNLSSTVNAVTSNAALTEITDAFGVSLGYIIN